MYIVTKFGLIWFTISYSCHRNNQSKINFQYRISRHRVSCCRAYSTLTSYLILVAWQKCICVAWQQQQFLNFHFSKFIIS